MYPTQPFFYVNNDVISMLLHDWSTGGLLLVCPRAWFVRLSCRSPNSTRPTSW